MTFYFRLLTFEMFRKEGAFHEEDGESRGDCYGIRLFENKAIRSSGEELKKRVSKVETR